MNFGDLSPARMESQIEFTLAFVNIMRYTN